MFKTKVEITLKIVEITLKSINVIHHSQRVIIVPRKLVCQLSLKLEFITVSVHLNDWYRKYWLLHPELRLRSSYLVAKMKFFISHDSWILFTLNSLLVYYSYCILKGLKDSCACMIQILCYYVEKVVQAGLYQHGSY